MLVVTLLAITVLFGKSYSQDFDQSVQVTIRWKEHFVGWIDITALHDVDDGWRLRLNFTEPVKNLVVFDTVLVSVNDNYTEYILANTPHNDKISVGTKLRLLMFGDMERDISFDADCSVIAFVAPLPPEFGSPRQGVPMMGEPMGDMSAEPLFAEPLFAEPLLGEPMMSVPIQLQPYDYAEAMRLSILFYEIQRSGDLPLVRNISWRYCSAMDDKTSKGEDLTGGYYDAGDFLKFSVTIAYTASLMSWGYITYPDVYKDNGLDKDLLTAIKWGTDYLVKCHIDTDEFVYQVGNPGADHAYWGRPEEMTMDRPAYIIGRQAGRRGSEPTALAAAALASASIALKDEYPCGEEKMVSHARELYELANKYRGIYQDNGYYVSNGYGDELCFAAIWLYLATDEEQYLQDAKDHFEEFNLQGRPYAFSWSDVRSGCQVLLYKVTKETIYYESFTNFLDNWLPGGGIPYTNKGLVFRDLWGSLRYAAAASWIALAAAEEGIRPTAYRRFAESQIHYILGESGRSFLIGYGENYPLHPHHRSSSCPDLPANCGWGNGFVNPGPNPKTCYGALVGGPRDLHDTYTDSRSNYHENEVAIDYNAGLVPALAGIAKLYS